MRSAMLAACGAALCLLFTQATQAIQSTPNGVPGVEDGTCWKNTVGNNVSVKVRGTVMGDQEITITEGNNSGRGRGNPDPDGGCAETQNPISVGNEKYRIHNGKVQHKNDSGQWVNMSKTKCSSDEER